MIACLGAFATIGSLFAHFLPGNWWINYFLGQWILVFLIIQGIFLVHYLFNHLKTRDKQNFSLARWLTLIACLYTFVLNIQTLQGFLLPIAQRKLDHDTFRWFHLDADKCTASNFNALTKMITRFHPDVIDLENTHSCRDAINFKSYPYQISLTSNFLLISRFPLNHLQSPPTSTATIIKTPFGAVYAVLFLSAQQAWEPNSLIQLSRQYSFAASKLPFVLVGNFNSVSWTTLMETSILSPLKLSDAARGYRFQPTWYLPLPSPIANQQILGLTWDHFFINSFLQVQSYQVGENLGLPHRPIWVDLKIVSPDRKGHAPIYFSTL
jgi:hypothetical protein